MGTKCILIVYYKNIIRLFCYIHNNNNNNRDVQKSTDLLETMEIRKIAPNSKVYCNLLRGVAETSNQERFGKIWYQMTSFGINLSEKEKISVIRSLSKGNLHSLIPHVSSYSI